MAVLTRPPAQHWPVTPHLRDVLEASMEKIS